MWSIGYTKVIKDGVNNMIISDRLKQHILDTAKGGEYRLGLNVDTEYFKVSLLDLEMHKEVYMWMDSLTKTRDPKQKYLELDCLIGIFPKEISSITLNGPSGDDYGYVTFLAQYVDTDKIGGWENTKFKQLTIVTEPSEVWYNNKLIPVHGTYRLAFR